MGNVVNESVSKLNGVSQDYKAKAGEVGNQLDRVSHDVGAKLGSMASNIATTTSQNVQKGREYVLENPAKSLAMAVAAGAVAGSILTLAMRRGQR